MITFYEDARRTHLSGTGVYVRGIKADTGRWGNVDTAHLDRDSLEAWLRSRGNIEWPIGYVMILLGHELETGPVKAEK